MTFFSLHEAMDIVIMSALIGFLFMDFVSNRNKPFWERFKFSVLALAPVIIFHELAHKFTAMAFGLNAVFHAFYANSTTLFLGVIAILAKLSNFGFVFLVPGFVRICEVNGGVDTACVTVLRANPLWGAIIAFAGPFIHLVFWIVSALILKHKGNKLSDNWHTFFVINKKINMFLFILNMLPIPGIDGFSIYSYLSQAI